MKFPILILLSLNFQVISTLEASLERNSSMIAETASWFFFASIRAVDLIRSAIDFVNLVARRSAVTRRCAGFLSIRRGRILGTGSSTTLSESDELDESELEEELETELDASEESLDESGVA